MDDERSPQIRWDERRQLIPGLPINIYRKTHIDYSRLREMTSSLARNIEGAAHVSGIEIDVRHFGTMYSISFAKSGDFGIFYAYLLENGIHIAPSEFESNFISFGHTWDDIEKTADSINRAFRHMSKERT